MNFYGYRRPDGRVGVRNMVLILPASVCASDTARIISSQVVGSVTFNNQLGCSQVASDQQYTMDVMAGYAANPNVYGTVVVSLGCENCQMDLVVKAIEEIDTLSSKGRVEVRGQEWAAKTDAPEGKIPKDAIVVVEGIQGVKLIVRNGEETKI